MGNMICNCRFVVFICEKSIRWRIIITKTIWLSTRGTSFEESKKADLYRMGNYFKSGALKNRIINYHLNNWEANKELQILLDLPLAS